MINLGSPEIWFVCGSQHLYGPGPLQRVAANARDMAGGLGQSPKLPLKVVFKSLLTTPDEIVRLCMEANSDENCAGLILWMHTFSPSKMWIRGLNALQKPFLHLHTQFNRDLPWASIDMDFMNLNQSAHGDREAGFIHTRMRLARKVVVGHWADPEVHERIGCLDAGRAGLARLAGREVLPVRRQHAASGRHRGGQGVGRNEIRFRDQHLRGGGPRSGGRRRAGRRGERSRRRIRRALPGRPGTPPGRRAARFAPLRGPARTRTALVPRQRRLQGLYDDLRGPARSQAAPRARAAAPDGGRLRLRRGRRLEDGRARARDEGHGRRAAPGHVLHGGLHLRSGARRRVWSSARTCSRSVRRSPRASPRSRFTA